MSDAIIDLSLAARNLLNITGIQALLDVEGTTEVAMNRPHELWSEVNGVWIRHERPQLDLSTCEMLAQALAVRVNNDSDQLRNPICPVVLPGGERGQIVMPPATERGCISMTIRKPSLTRFSLDDYFDSGRLSNFNHITRKKTDIDDWQKEMVMSIKRGDLREFFRLAVINKVNMIFGGRTGSGKTTFSKAVVDLYPANRRYITLEDTHELFMPNHPNRVHLFYGPHMSATRLVESCMRMKGDHIFMAELKGDETWAYLTLLKTGHDGSITTGHFGSPEGCFSRLTDMVKQSHIGITLDERFIYRTVQSTIDVVATWEGSYLKEIMYRPEEKLQILNGE